MEEREKRQWQMKETGSGEVGGRVWWGGGVELDSKRGLVGGDGGIRGRES